MCDNPKTIALLGGNDYGKVRLVCAISDDIYEINASNLLKAALEQLGRKGGGTSRMAQGGISIADPKKIIRVIQKVVKQV